MKFLMLMIPSVYQGANVDENHFPEAKDIEKMMAFNEELAKAGALVALDGLRPLSHGARVAYPGGKPVTTDGPFIESKEVVGGYWIINVASKEEAVRWAEKIPAMDGDVVEVRPVYDLEDFPEEARQAAESEIVTAAIQ